MRDYIILEDWLGTWELNCLKHLTGSQCRDDKIGVIYSYFLDLVRSLADAFLLSILAGINYIIVYLYV